ncbi:MAG: ral nucleoside transport system permease protein [Myxococcales bacterium]|jgi:simple sugar transport system permease protein|nr:ral nucleoside transport system permease protein [Myxococcales bacterium]
MGIGVSVDGGDGPEVTTPAAGSPPVVLAGDSPSPAASQLPTTATSGRRKVPISDPSAPAGGPGIVRRTLAGMSVPMSAFVTALALFGVFILMTGHNPFAVYYQMYRGSFGTWFSFQNTLLRAAPLMLTALATALPLRLGLVGLGGEGAMVMGGLAAAAASMAAHNHGPTGIKVAMLVAGALMGGLWIAFAGALRAYRGVNETISTLLLNYIAIALLNHIVEGPLRDPASLNKPSTPPIGDENMLGNLPGLDVHWGLAFGLVACAITWFLMNRTTFGFAARMVGGNVRAALLNGLPVGRLIVITTFIGGLCAGLAGGIEVAAIHGTANASLVTGYGYTGVLVAFIARGNPLAVIPVALILGGIGASGGLLQRLFDLPDATVNVLQGILFISILFSETFYGRGFGFLRRNRRPPATAAADKPAVVVI